MRISAQARLRAFYVGLGFESVGDEYLEDDIPAHRDVMEAAMSVTHEVFNQAAPLADANLFAAATGRCATRWPSTRRASIASASTRSAREVGSAAMQAHARLANVHPPQLHTHDRFGRRIDQVEFHPSYHALMARALRHRPARHAVGRRRGRARRRAAGFMLFTELEPSMLCPISMTYAVTPALRAQRRRCPPTGAQAGEPRLRRALRARRAEAGRDDGHGHDREAGRLGRARQHARAPTSTADDAWGRRFRITGHKWFMSAPMCDAFLVLAQAARRA